MFKLSGKSATEFLNKMLNPKKTGPVPTPNIDKAIKRLMADYHRKTNKAPVV